eukprot:Phypoly_transcript_11523.p1 GENE.Phypoly_transcript_11523~~Phypoly_transcript_11523.p1  ORF type:complete len:292 (+),score=48.46 Phypoly_transcript_11523:52-927(+)
MMWASEARVDASGMRTVAGNGESPAQHKENREKESYYSWLAEDQGEDRLRMSQSREQLLQEIESLRQQRNDLEMRVQGAGYLEEDRRQLNKEVLELRAQNAELKKKNEELDRKVTLLIQDAATSRASAESSALKKQSVVQSLLEAIIAERWVATDDEQKEKDEQFRQKFKLPKGEYALAYYSCTDGSSHPGYVYITLQYLIWEHSSMILGGDNLTIPISDIESINKVKMLKFLPGKGTSIEIKMREGKVHALNAFFSRKEAIKKIVAQGRILGHNITILRAGVPDENSGVK